MTWKDQLLVVVLFQKIKASRLTERLLLKTVTLSTGKKYLMLENITKNRYLKSSKKTQTFLHATKLSITVYLWA